MLDASECGPTFNTDRVVGVIAGGQVAVSTASESAEDNPRVGRRWRSPALGVGRSDAVVGHQRQRAHAVRARRGRARPRGRCADRRARLQRRRASSARRSSTPIEVLVGPEFIAGSTRLKAGTAQKLVLNMLSTLTMVRLGKTYGNLMVDVRVTNAKLRDRATRIVEQVAGVDHDARGGGAGRGRRRRQGRGRRCCAPGRPPEAARERLDAAGGHLRRALMANEGLSG